MNYLIIISSILITLLTLIAGHYTLMIGMKMLDRYKHRQHVKSQLHPEVSMDDLDNEEEMIVVQFDRDLTARVLSNEEEGLNEPINIMLLTRDDDDEDEDEDDESDEDEEEDEQVPAAKKAKRE